jgi:hypothetical protein
VSAAPTLVPHLSHRVEIYQFPNPFTASNWGDNSLEGRRLPAAASIDFVIAPAETEESEKSSMRIVGDGFTVGFSNDYWMVLERVR